ncbi:MAG: hypothetical protein IT211_04185 [Armatimonadetes bacterium]|nr:hypothetical protein [Armatimonadota bacterium]
MIQPFRQILFIASIFWLLLVVPVSAQVRRLPGAVLGLGAGYDHGILIPASGTQEYDPYSNYTQTPWAGFTMIFPKLFGEGLGLSTTMNYAQYNLHATSTQSRTLQTTGGTSTTATVEHRYDFFSQAAQWDFMFYAQMGKVARFEVGPWGGIGFFPEWEETEAITQPSDARFSNGQTTQTVDAGRTTREGVGTFGVAIRASFEIPFLFGSALLPSLNARVGGVMPTDQNASDAGISGTIGAGFTLLFGNTQGELVPSEPMPEPVSAARPDTAPVPPPVRPTPSLTATLDFYSQTAVGRRADTLWLQPERTLHQMEFALPNTVRFDPNSASLPNHYRPLERAAATTFTLDSLAGLDASELVGQTLNIVGFRMAHHPSARLTVTGGKQRSEPAWFARARAETVREYLTTVWGIQPTRITVAAAKGGNNEAEVKFAASLPEILQPVNVEWIEQEVVAGSVGIEPQIAAQHGVKGWRVTVLRNGKEIATLRDTDGGSGGLDAGLLLGDAATSGALPLLQAELVVEDSAGATAIARDLLVVASGTVNEALAQHLFRRHILLVVSATELERIAAQVHDSATVTVATTPSNNPQSIRDTLVQALSKQGKNRVAVQAVPVGQSAIAADPAPVEITISQRY